MKTTLKQLAELFKDYASSDDNPQPIRQFAAQLALLTAHVGRIENDNLKARAAFDGQIAELAQYILKLRQGAAPKTTAQSQPTPAVQAQAADSDEVNVEEDDIDALVKKVQAENAAAAAETAATLMQPQKPTNGQVEASS